ncbi:MAG: UDP-N-acetylmuramate dehydrogenase [Saprospiraceae bacterium]
MIHHPDFNLTDYNTFGLPARARDYAAFERTEDIVQLLDRTGGEPPLLLLGSGSNLLLLSKLDGWVWHNRITDLEVITQSATAVHLRIGGGYNWNELVQLTLKNGWAGLENLSLIPGTVGAAPVQNIGAYGAELADCCTSVEAVDLTTGRQLHLPAADCGFAYRDSRFKRQLGRYVITHVHLRLTPVARAEVNTDYGDISRTLADWGITRPAPTDVAGAVVSIRRSKLPDWRLLGNAGSFFKNPVVSRLQLAELTAAHGDIPAYPLDEFSVKLPAGWLIDRAGWRGRTVGRVGCYEKQALVIVNRGGAAGEEVLAFSEMVQAGVRDKFGVELEREVRVVGEQRDSDTE